MPPIAQPFRVQWSPSTTPTSPPSWEDLGEVASLTVDRGRGTAFFDEYKPGIASVVLRNGDHAGRMPVHLLSAWRRWTPLRVLVDAGSGDRAVFTGYITKLEHDLTDAPFAGRVNITATDAMGVWTRQSISRDSSDMIGVPRDEFGFGPYDVAELAAEVDYNGAAGAPDIAGLARAPVVLPASVTTEEGVEVARFVAKSFEALLNALKVEMGTVHIAAGGALAINGRYAVADAVSGAPTEAFVLTDDATAINGTTAFGYHRSSLKFADPNAEYHNGAATAGLRQQRHTVQVGDDDIEDQIDRTDLWCVDENWVEADAELLANLYAGVQQPWPAEVSVPLWNSALDDLAFLEAVLDATDILGRSFIGLAATQPGSDTPAQFGSSIEGIRIVVDAAEARAVLKLGVAAARWVIAYDLSVGIFALDIDGRGLDTDAIIGP